MKDWIFLHRITRNYNISLTDEIIYLSKMMIEL